eukprot:m.344815 g.344815  ORF g.344815 m.344815 type:complete len:374 (-) comp25205_c0_seq1:30-1151(-)
MEKLESVDVAEAVRRRLRSVSDIDDGYDFNIVELGPKSNTGHLMVLCHGIIGTVADFNNMVTEMQSVERHAWSHRMIVLRITSNGGYHKTTQGVQFYANNVVREIKSFIIQNGDKFDLQYFSICGHSLGGVVAREAIKRLWEQEILVPGSKIASSPRKNVKGYRQLSTVLFMAIASPFVGINVAKERSCVGALYKTLAPFAAGQTAYDLQLDDRTQEPLLHRMVKAPYISVLQAFEHRVIIANVRNDFLVPYNTAFIRDLESPFKETNIKQLAFKNDICPYLIDVEKSKFCVPPDEMPPLTYDTKRSQWAAPIIRELNKVSWIRHHILMDSEHFPQHAQIIEKHKGKGGVECLRFVVKEIEARIESCVSRSLK